MKTKTLSFTHKSAANYGARASARAQSARKIVNSTLICATLLLFAAALIFYPDRYIPACFQAFCIWAESVLPSLFPFMVICSIAIKTGAARTASGPFSKLCRKINLPGEALPLFVMSVCSGYPAGSRMLSEYYSDGCVSMQDCKKLAPLCSTAGPLFITGTVGYKAFGGGSAGIKLLCACLLSVAVTSIIYALLSKRGVDNAAKPAPSKQGDALYDSFYGAFIAVCCAGGFIAFFYTLASVLSDFKVFALPCAILSPLFGDKCASALLAGACEATGGCFALAGAGGFFALPLAGFLITFGGASILAQQLCYLNKCGVKAGFFILFKFVQGVVSFALLCLFSLF